MKDILFLAHRSPFPPDRGDRIRSFNILRYLAARARVHLIAYADAGEDGSVAPELAALTASCTIVPRTRGRWRATAEALAQGRPVSLTAFDTTAMRAAVRRAPRVDAVYVFSGQMAQFAPADVSVVMDFVDVDSAKFAALARTAAWPLRPLLRREARLLGRFEQAVAARVQAALFVSAAEAALFRSGDSAGQGAGRVEVVENGIDAAFFDPDARFERPALTGPLIVFTGQMDYQPNVDAVAWFAREVLPRVRRRHADARFAIVGRGPTGAVRALARLPGVIVTGAVADVRGWLAAAQVCVAPLDLARGVQNKVLEAMAMARPVVASAAAAEGIAHDGTIVVTEGSDGWTEAVCSALERAADNPAARVRALQRYDWSARLSALDGLLDLPPLPASVAA